MDSKQLIEKSRSTNTIVHADYTTDLALDLLVQCDDNVSNGDEVEYWGADWRVHLDHEPSNQ